MKIGLVIGVAFMLNALSGCSQSVPDCDSKKVVDLVIKTANDNWVSQFGGVGSMQWEVAYTSVHTIRTTDVNEKTKARRCAAQIDKKFIYKDKSRKDSMVQQSISYTVEKIEGKDDLYVSISGL